MLYAALGDSFVFVHSACDFWGGGERGLDEEWELAMHLQGVCFLWQGSLHTRQWKGQWGKCMFIPTTSMFCQGATE
jgi:hypothetical protein